MPRSAGHERRRPRWPEAHLLEVAAALAVKAQALALQQATLPIGPVQAPAGRDFSLCVNHPMPGNAAIDKAGQGPADRARAARRAQEGRNLAIGHEPAARNAAHDGRHLAHEGGDGRRDCGASTGSCHGL